MAKRRKLQAPSADQINQIEEEFRRETSGVGRVAPIAQVAAETAQALETESAAQRSLRARDERDAKAFRAAESDGLLLIDLPLHEIEPLSLQRDRSLVDQVALEELEYSIAEHGVRLPIEVYHLRDHPSQKRYGLLSGYRRLIAQRNVYAKTGDESFSRIKAIVRDPDAMGGAFVAMVEENEIRQDLSHYERGRIASIAAQQGAFATTDDAVAKMFAAASKAKRSKIRSFALIFVELGDLLQFPESLREKDGLKLAQGLKSGAQGQLRKVLADGAATNAKSEWSLIESVLDAPRNTIPEPSRGGRPRNTDGNHGPLAKVQTTAGITIECERDTKGYTLRFRGAELTYDVMDQLLRDIEAKLNTG